MKDENVFTGKLILAFAAGAAVTAALFIKCSCSKNKSVDEWKGRLRDVRKKESSDEKKKMVEEQLYSPLDSLLSEERVVAHDGCALFNQLTLSTELATRRDILHLLVGAYSKESLPVIEPPFFCDYGYNIKLGKGVFFNHDCVLLDCAPIVIGDYSLFGPNCLLVTPNHPLDANVRTSATFPEVARSINIGDRCWLGSGAIVCPGVTIGDNCVVAAGAVVTRDVPPNSLVAGIPARVVKDLHSSCF